MKLLYCAPVLALAGALTTIGFTSTFAQPSHPTLKETFGVAVKLLDLTPQDFELLHDAGITWVRSGIRWHLTETTKNTYNFSTYDGPLQDLKTIGARPLLTLNYSNPLYESTVTTTTLLGKPSTMVRPPGSPDAIAAYQRWAGQTARHFSPLNPILELWNEPDHPTFWPPKPDPAAYVDLAAPACRAIKDTLPSARVLAPALAYMPQPDGQNTNFIRYVLRSPLMACATAVSVHPYQPSEGPRGFATSFDMLKDIMKAAKHANFPIIASEWGYSTYVKPWYRSSIDPRPTISDDDQANYLIQQQMLHFSEGVPLSIWYNWRDDGTDPENREHHFGLLRFNGTPKPAYQAVKLMISKLGACRYAGKIPPPSQATIILKLACGTSSALVGWSTTPATLILANARDISISTILREPPPTSYADSKVHLTLGQRPIYIQAEKEIKVLSVSVP